MPHTILPLITRPILLGLAISSLIAISVLPADDDDYFPLAKGTTWTYSARIERPDTYSDRIDTHTITFTIQVIDELRAGTLHAARLRCSPYDPASDIDRTQPSDHIIIRTSSGRYHYLTTRADHIWRTLCDTRGALPLDILTDANTLFPAPLQPGDTWGDPSTGAIRTVQRDTPFLLTFVKGAPAIPDPRSYLITCRTPAQHRTIDFVPHLGIVAFTYGDHTSPATTSARLIAFHQ